MDLNISAETVLRIIPEIVILIAFVVRMDSRMKTQQELSDLKFLTNAERIQKLETEMNEKILSNATKLESLNQKYDLLNKEVLAKLSQIELVMVRLQERFQFFDKEQSTKGV